MIELKPCPFCGNKDIKQLYKSNMGYVYDVEITCDSCKTVFSFYDEGKKSIKDQLVLFETWNRRPSGWISVKERLPEDSIRILLFSSHRRKISEGDYTYYDGLWCDVDGYTHDTGDITHWMPLPKPPEVEE